MQKRHQSFVLPVLMAGSFVVSVSLAEPEDFEIDAAPAGSTAVSEAPVGQPSATTASSASAVTPAATTPATETTAPVAAPAAVAVPPAAASSAPSREAPTEVPDVAPEPAATAETRTETVSAPSIQVATAHAFSKGIHSRPVPFGISPRGFIQAQYLLSELSEDQLQQDETPRNLDEFALRAARVRLDGGYEYSSFAAELDASTLGGASLKIRRAEATVLFRGKDGREGPPLVAITAGVTDVPFGYELVESTRERIFMERTTGSDALFPTQMDVGAKAWGGFSFLRYALGFMNGQALDSSAFEHDPNAKKELVGRLGADVVVADAFNIEGGTSFSFGKGFHPGRPAEKDSLNWRDDNEDGIATATEIVGAPGSAARPSANFERWALGLDLRPRFRTPLGVSTILLEAIVASNHDRGLFVSDPVDTGFDLRQTALSASIVQTITPYALVGFRAAKYDPNHDLFEQRRGEFSPRSLGVTELSPLVGVVLPERASFIVQYDFLRDHLARDLQGVPVDADNDQLTLRLQVEL